MSVVGHMTSELGHVTGEFGGGRGWCMKSLVAIMYARIVVHGECGAQGHKKYSGMGFLVGSPRTSYGRVGGEGGRKGGREDGREGGKGGGGNKINVKLSHFILNVHSVLLQIWDTILSGAHPTRK